jgi:hypothetical protein
MHKDSDLCFVEPHRQRTRIKTRPVWSIATLLIQIKQFAFCQITILYRETIFIKVKQYVQLHFRIEKGKFLQKKKELMLISVALFQSILINKYFWIFKVYYENTLTKIVKSLRQKEN